VLWIDHAVYAVRDLDEAEARFREDFGLVSIPGGLHPGWGTGNRIVPLGRDYVELMAVLDPRIGATTRLGSALIERTRDGDGWFGWCVADDELEGTARRLGLEIEAGSRTRPDGTVVSWRSAGIEDPRRTSDLPFFISWGVEPTMHPGAEAVAHPSAATAIGHVELFGDRLALEAWTAGAALPVSVAPGGPALGSVTLATAVGDLRIS
jgi:hypothetical protein